MDEKCRTILEKLLIVHILKFFEEYSSLLFEGNYTNNGEIIKWIEQRLLNICHELRNELACLVDVFAPPDHILNSVLGKSDGQVYRSINQMIRMNARSSTVPSWLKNELAERSKL